jgi:hypothetical protein
MSHIALPHVPAGHVVVDQCDICAIAHVVLTNEKGERVAKSPAVYIQGHLSVKMFAVKSFDGIDLRGFLTFSDADNDPVYVRPGMIEIVVTSSAPAVFVSPSDIYIRGSNRPLSVVEPVESVTKAWMEALGNDSVAFSTLDAALPVDLSRILGRSRGTPDPH